MELSAKQTLPSGKNLRELVIVDLSSKLTTLTVWDNDCDMDFAEFEVIKIAGGFVKEFRNRLVISSAASLAILPSTDPRHTAYRRFAQSAKNLNHVIVGKRPCDNNVPVFEPQQLCHLERGLSAKSILTITEIRAKTYLACKRCNSGAISIDGIVNCPKRSCTFYTIEGITRVVADVFVAETDIPIRVFEEAFSEIVDVSHFEVVKSGEDEETLNEYLSRLLVGKHVAVVIQKSAGQNAGSIFDLISIEVSSAKSAKV